MNRVSHCGLEPPKPFYSLEEGVAVRQRLDDHLEKIIENWNKTVPYAQHLESKEINQAWYRRNMIEHVWRMRLSQTTHAQAQHAISKISPEAGQLYAEYNAEEMNHSHLYEKDLLAIGVSREELLSTEPFLSTRLYEAFFYFICEHEDPIGIVAASYLNEYTTAKLTPKHVEAMEHSLGEDLIKGQSAHLNTDLGDDHAGEMWRVMHYLITCEEDVDKIIAYLDDCTTILAMYFTELYNATVGQEEQKNAA